MAGYQGDIHLGDTIDIKFVTTSASTGAPTTLSGSPVISAYVGNSTTQITAGITLSVDFDGVTGLNNVRVVASGGNGFAGQTNISLIITTGTVGGTSAVGYEVGSFSVDNRPVNLSQILGTAVSPPATAGILDVNVKNINNVAAATPGASGGVLISGSNTGTTTFGAMTVTGSLTVSDGLLVSRSTSNASAITATGNGTGSGIVATSGSGATGDGLRAIAASTNGNGFTAAKTGTGKDLNATSTPLTLAKTTNITGFNDIAAGDVWDVAIAGHLSAGSTGLALNSAGSAGDPWSTALPGAYGAGTAGNILGNNLNATVSSRMATYTQPTGFLAATFPGTVASPTNITAGVITTVTNLTNAPTLGDFTATMKTSIGTAVAASAVASVTGNVGGNVVGSVASVTAGVTVTTNNDKTGYALTSAGNISVADAMLDRDMSVGTDSGSPTVRTPRQAFRALRNKNSALTGIVTKEDDVTTSWTYTVTTDAAALPITSIDPA